VLSSSQGKLWPQRSSAAQLEGQPRRREARTFNKSFQGSLLGQGAMFGGLGSIPWYLPLWWRCLGWGAWTATLWAGEGEKEVLIALCLYSGPFHLVNSTAPMNTSKTEHSHGPKGRWLRPRFLSTV
jgi:hypothetical protein